MALIRALRASNGWGPLDDRWYSPVGTVSGSGADVDATSALSASPVWAAVRLLADSVASLPLMVYKRRADGGKEIATDHPVYDLLHDQPNKIQTSFAFKRVLMVHALLWGNGYAIIKPGPRGPVDQLVPMHPDGVRVEDIAGGGIRYMVRDVNGREQPVNDESVFHIPGLSLDGVSGLSLMRMARESIGINLSARQWSASFFRNGGRPSGALKHPGKLSKEARDRLREDWQTMHGGTSGAHRVAILQEGMEWQQTGLAAQDAQLLGLLEWSAADCARYFNVPLHMIQETAKVTSWGSGIEQLSNGFVTYSLLPWLVNWQQTILKDLIVASRTYFAEFVTDALLRGSTLDRYNAYQIAAGGNAPWMTRNEVRARENLNPLPGLDDPLRPLNMTPDSAVDPVTGLTLREKTAAAGELMRAGFVPDDVTQTVGLPPMEHVGLPPVTVQSPKPATSPDGGTQP